MKIEQNESNETSINAYDSSVSQQKETENNKENENEKSKINNKYVKLDINNDTFQKELNPPPKQRTKWLDILKAILILCVAASHVIGGNYHELTRLSGYLFLFHLPCFFMVSGYLYKESNKFFIITIKRRIKRLIIPYLIYLYFHAVPMIVYGYFKEEKNKENSFAYIKLHVKSLLLGGMKITKYQCGALWYLPVLLFSTIIFLFIEVK